MKLYTILSLALFGACGISDQGKQFSFERKLLATTSGESTCRLTSNESRDEWIGAMTPTEKAITQLYFKYLSPAANVRYLEWSLSPEDRPKVKELLAALSASRAQALSRAEQLANHINMYNLATIDLIIGNYEKTLGGDDSPMPGERSIRNIDNRDFGIWDLESVVYGAETLSLNQIEKGLIIPLRDARIHFAVNCASVGCPPLAHHAFTADRIEQQLEDVSCRFVNSGAQTLFDNFSPETPIVFTSQILQWYDVDFREHIGDSFSDVRSFLANYLDPDLHGIQGSDLFRINPATSTFAWSIEFDDYDWALNEEASP